ncbi:MAG: hypothetical protein P1S60_13555, partial [Anaerolineae bacterium]|nr:hypothetical protein [Anaerolineae bacterium]
ILDKILPANPPDARQRVAVASTYLDTYAGIPDAFTEARLQSRGVSTYRVFDELAAEVGEESRAETNGAPVLGYLEFAFPENEEEVEVQRHILPAAGG